MIIIINLNIKYNQYVTILLTKMLYIYTIFNKVDHLNFDIIYIILKT